MLAIVVTAILVMFSSVNFSGHYIWDGEIYSALVKKYLVTGELSSLGPGDLPLWAKDIPQQSYFNRIAYYWAAQVVMLIYPLHEKFLFPLLDFLPFTVAAIFLYLSCYRYLSLSILASFFAAIWLLVLPAAKVIYQVVAHPEALCLMLMSVGFYLSLGRHHLAAALVLLFAMLSRESAAMMSVYLLLHHYWQQPREPGLLRRYRPQMLYAGSVFAGLAIPLCIQQRSSLSSFSFFNLVIETNRLHPLPYLLFNFNILIIPYVLGFWRLKRQEQLNHLALWLLSILLLSAALDWWRVLYGNLHFAVLPLAAITIYRVFRHQSIYVFVLITLYLASFPGKLNWTQLKIVTIWPYCVLLLLFIAQSYREKRCTILSDQVPQESPQLFP